MFKKVLLPISALIALIAISILTTAQTATKPIARFTATTESQSVRIEVFAWSTEADRDEFGKAWTSPPKPVVVEAEAPAGNRGGGGRGNRGGGGGRGNRGGRGGGGDEAPAPASAPAAPITPAASLGSSLNKAASVGMLWTSETVGYSIRYAYRVPQPDGSERIILATDRRLGAWNNAWKTSTASSNIDYPFSVIELRLTATGTGEGKVSLTNPIKVDSVTKSIALEDYANAPIVLKAVKRQAAK
jgi:hypothetical protein